VTEPGTAEDFTPATNPPDTGDQTVGNVPITITKSRVVPIRWNGEEEAGVDNGGPGSDAIRIDQIAQAFRTLTNEMEADLASLYKYASRAFGTAGTTPFGSTIKDLAEVRRILVDNGCPETGLQFVMDSAAGVNFRALSNLYKVNEGGSDTLLRQGLLTENLYGFGVRESAQVKQHTKGTGSGYLVNNASGIAYGATTVAVDTGSGTILAGDIITNTQSGVDANNKYVVNTALGGGGTFVLNKPGVRVSGGWGNNDTLAVGNSYRANMAFHRSAIVLATRPPKMPKGGDMARDRITVTDPRSGLSFEIAMYPQYGRMRYEVRIAWGFAAVKSENIALLLG